MPANETAYIPPDIPVEEEERLKELHGLDLLYTAAEVRFDRYTSLVAQVFGFPVVFVSLVDRERQWFKSAVGWDLTDAARDISFCGHAINQTDVLVVRDALEDPRFAANPMVKGPPHIRFYAGAVVHGPGGQPLGTLCLIDHQAREFDDRQCALLRQFADLVEIEIRHAHDLKTIRASVEFSAYYDPLTELPNRSLFMDRLARIVEMAELEQHQAVVLLFKVSGLRVINQSLGTEVGDEILRQLGQRLSDCCPAGGSVARLQAGDFVLAFPIVNRAAENLESVLSRARIAVDKPFSHKDSEHYLSVQIGGSLFPDHGSRPGQLIEQASAAIRFDGMGEPGAVCFFSKTESESFSERLAIESGLRRAVEKHEFHLLYQPIVSLSDGRLAGVEALLRWDNQELSPITPDRFIPIAEQAGLMATIGRWVQEEVCRQIQKWRNNQGMELLSVALNVSGAELVQPDFARDLIARMEAAAIEGAQVCTEVTEFSLISDTELVNQNLELLRSMAVSVNIDDFGTGYSSLSYLRILPVSNLKIDRTFIQGLPDNKDDVTLVRTIISMARSLGLGLIAEGVETPEQLEFLRQNGCQFIQGFLVSRPVSPDEIPAFLDRKLV